MSCDCPWLPTRPALITHIAVQVGRGGGPAYSLDGGKTVFPSLQHLVEFHRLNTGLLPALLTWPPS